MASARSGSIAHGIISGMGQVVLSQGIGAHSTSSLYRLLPPCAAPSSQQSYYLSFYPNYERTILLYWGALFRPQGTRAICFENSSKFRNRIWRAFGARIDFGILIIFVTITLLLYIPREVRKFEIPSKF